MTESELSGFHLSRTLAPVFSPSFCTKGLISLIWLELGVSLVALVRLARAEISVIWFAKRFSSIGPAQYSRREVFGFPITSQEPRQTAKLRGVIVSTGLFRACRMATLRFGRTVGISFSSFLPTDTEPATP